MGRVTDSEYITIGALARASGLTATALRFYDDCGLLPPARVDAVTGYRYYTPDQRDRAATIRRLREIDVPLDTVAAVLNGDAARAGRLLDTHVDTLERRARAAAAAVARIKDALVAESDPDLVALQAADLAEAIEQVRSAAARDAGIPALTGILVEAAGDSVTLTATDRYRLSTRSLVPTRAPARPWSLVVRAHALTTSIEPLRRAGQVRLAPAPDALTVTGLDSEHRCPSIDEPFPDYRAMLAALAPPRTRVVVDRDAFLAAVREAGDGTLRCVVETDGNAGTVTVSADPVGAARRIPAAVNGSGVRLAFDPATLSPAIAGAVGPEIMLDIAGPADPIVIRSATAGELTTLAMPCAPGSSAGA
ncbi:DNA polymerase-3 subunit beta [Nocardia sp. GAS34]|jgi:DNA polymerase-3 subunit beta